MLACCHVVVYKGPLKAVLSWSHVDLKLLKQRNAMHDAALTTVNLTPGNPHM